MTVVAIDSHRRMGCPHRPSKVCRSSYKPPTIRVTAMPPSWRRRTRIGDTDSFLSTSFCAHTGWRRDGCVSSRVGVAFRQQPL